MRTLAIATLFIASLAAFCQDGDRRAIADAVRLITQRYPQATLQDIYKSFFQDQFGPGHLIADTARAADRLRRELASSHSFAGPSHESTGFRGRYVRVNLSVIRQGAVSFNRFFSLFTKSAAAAKPIDPEQWANEWRTIAGVIATMGLKLKNFHRDSIAIDSLLTSGKYAMHHSREYNQAYQPHYRIMERKLFEAEILPLIKQTTKQQTPKEK